MSGWIATRMKNGESLPTRAICNESCFIVIVTLTHCDRLLSRCMTTQLNFVCWICSLTAFNFFTCRILASQRQVRVGGFFDTNNIKLIIRGIVNYLFKFNVPRWDSVDCIFGMKSWICRSDYELAAPVWLHVSDKHQVKYSKWSSILADCAVCCNSKTPT